MTTSTRSPLASANGPTRQHTWELTGIVMHGRRLGRTIGFPTANIDTDGADLPADGVYAGFVEGAVERDVLMPAAISVGSNPTVGGRIRTVEAHLLDFDGDLYGRTLRVLSVRHIRDMTHFAGLPELITAITADVQSVRTLTRDLPRS